MLDDLFKIGSKVVKSVFGGGNSGDSGKTAKPVTNTVAAAQITPQDLAVLNANVVYGLTAVADNVAEGNRAEANRDYLNWAIAGGALLFLILLSRRKG